MCAPRARTIWRAGAPHPRTWTAASLASVKTAALPSAHTSMVGCRFETLPASMSLAWSFSHNLAGRSWLAASEAEDTAQLRPQQAEQAYDYAKVHRYHSPFWVSNLLDHLASRLR